MLLIVLAIRDRSADVFDRPSFHQSEGAAKRAFADGINDKRPGNVMADHPEDFDLYKLGFYDDATGEFICEKKPQQIAVGKDCVRKPVKAGN